MRKYLSAFLFGAIALIILGAAAPSPIQHNPFTTNVYPAQIQGGQDFAGNVQVVGSFTNQALTANLPIVTDANKKLVSVSVTTLTPAASVAVDFNGTAYQTLAISADTTFTGSNLGSPKSIAVKLFAPATNCNLTFPAWVFIGSAAPSSITSNKTAVLSVTAFGTDPTNVVAVYAVQP